jgi:hypothetical protein
MYLILYVQNSLKLLAYQKLKVRLGFSIPTLIRGELMSSILRKIYLRI